MRSTETSFLPCSRSRARSRPAPPRRRAPTPGSPEDDPRRRHDAALRLRVRVRSRRARGQRLLQVRELARRRQRPHDHLQDGRRRLRPRPTLQATQQLVEQDKVFAIFNSLGTEHNLATRDYLNAAKVPQLFVASGATTFGRDFKQYPWTIGFQPSYRAEGWVYGTYLARTKPGAKVGVLLQNDDYGKELLAGLRQGIARSKVKVVATQPFEVTDVDVQSQISRLKASGADVLALFAAPDHAVQGYVFANGLGWRPLIINNAASSASKTMTLASEGGLNKAVENSISIVFLKDPTDAEVAERRRGEALPLDHVPLRAGREPEGRQPRLRDGGRLRVREGAEGGRQEPDPRVGDGADAEAERPVQPVPAARADGRDERDGALPDRAGAAAALVEGALDELRRALGVPSGIGSGACSTRRSTTCSRRRASDAAATGSSPTRPRSSSR